MLQNANAPRKRPGRRPSFDPDVVIAGAMSAFWAKGFEATTTADLEAATGVDRSTIYNSFGGKTGLYRSSVATYIERCEAELFAPLQRGTGGLSDILEFLDLLAAAFGSGGNPPGCLIVNDMAADIDHAATDRYLRGLQDGLSESMNRAAASGETDSAKTDERSQFLTAAVLGINIVHRNGTTTASPQQLINGLRAEVQSWVTPSSASSYR